MAEWIGIVNATAPKFFAGASDHTVRNRLWLRMLEQKGRIRYNENGTICYWDVEYAQQPVESYGDAGVINFSRHDLLKQLNIDWRGYVASDMMTEKERLMNSGNVAIVNRYSRIMPTLLKALNGKFSKELTIDGYAAGNENRLHGIDSFTGTGTVAAADRIAQPSDTYGGQSTAVGASGTWTSNLSTYPNSTIATDWPDGSGDADYDWNSPKLVNWSSTNWGTNSSTAWIDNCERVFRQTTIWLMSTGGQDARPTMYLCAPNLFYDYANHQEAKTRILIPHKEANDLGFPDVLNQEGVMVQADFDVPANTAYGINVNEMELCSLSGSLFTSRGPIYDIKTDSYLFKAGFFGNCRYKAKSFAKIKNYA